MNRIDATSLTGAAGEHLVMSRLLSRGYIAALAPQGVPNMDIVVTSRDGEQLCSIQVKTRWDKGADGGWHMGRKHEDIANDRVFYCFVDLGKDVVGPQNVYIVPSGIVAKVIKSSHQNWLASPGLNGRVRKDSNMRRFLPDYSHVLGADSEYCAGWLQPYHESWDILERTPQELKAAQ